MGVFVLIALVLSSGCASVGTGDPLLVRAEDALTNSLTVYEAAMEWHFRHSKEEAPAVYKAFELIRTEFPPAWRALDAATKAYATTKSQPELQVALDRVKELYARLLSLWKGA